jgi:Zn-dependent M28 family amino/carboxypeptidase
VTSPAAAQAYEELPAGDTGWTLSLSVAAPETREFPGRNVVGIVRGSDPALKDTYVLLSAHYDHIGVRGSGEDRIFNGANDNASGTATLLEIAEAFAQLRNRPRRTLVFVAYFGEELGLLGSRYYSSRPVVPLEKTIVNLNFEHTGRTDDPSGNQAGKAAVTGFEFSTVAATLQKAGSYTGYKIVNRSGNEEYFERSDNEPLAQAGIPAHTIVVSVEYPDYHGARDHWANLDYPNMARFSQTMAVGALLLANSPEAPRWNSLDPRTETFREARERPAAKTKE